MKLNEMCGFFGRGRRNDASRFVRADYSVTCLDRGITKRIPVQLKKCGLEGNSVRGRRRRQRRRPGFIPSDTIEMKEIRREQGKKKNAMLTYYAFTPTSHCGWWGSPSKRRKKAMNIAGLFLLEHGDNNDGDCSSTHLFCQVPPTPPSI